MESLSYREVIPVDAFNEEWNEIKLNTGGTHSTLQDIKVAERAGGYCYKNVKVNHNRNRFIYWRSYQDVLELSEISLDFNLYQNNLRYKFTDSPVLSVTITEQPKHIVLLVTTVCSLHHIVFPHPDLMAKGNSGAGAGALDSKDEESFSIFKESNATVARDPSSFYVIQSAGSENAVPHAAAAFLAPNGIEAYFALACQTQLVLYAMNCATGHTVNHLLKDYNIVPRLFSNLKGALTGRHDISDAECATSLAFSCIAQRIYLLALYRNDCLRAWSVINLQSHCAINCVRDGSEKRTQGPQSNVLRKINDQSFCVFLSHTSGSEFVCIDLRLDAANNSTLNLIRRNVISAPQLDLADFDISESRIWALWSNAEGEFSISSFSLLRGSSMNWVSAAMEPPPDRYSLGIEHGMDPREAYCFHIFHPGKFEKSVIAKALFMFRRSSIRYDGNCAMNLLKKHVCQAVEDELQNELKDIDATDDDYLETSTRLWERFYSCCEQYHVKSSHPSGLLILEPLDGVCIIKKNSFSFLRPCDTLEHLMLAGDDVDANAVIYQHFAENETLGKDLLNLINLLTQIEKWLPEDIKIDFDRKLYQLEKSDVLIEKLADDLFASETDKTLLQTNLLVIIRQKLHSISNIRNAISLLFDSLRMDNGNPEIMRTYTHLSHATGVLMSLGALFSSQIGLSVLSATVRQNALIRFSLCRNLLLLKQILIGANLLSADILESLRTQYMPGVVTFLHSYYVMVWIAETPINMYTATAVDDAMQRLNLLQLATGAGRIHSNGGKLDTATLLHVFLNAKGLRTALAFFADNIEFEQSMNWQQTLMPLSTIVSQLTWAASYNFVFAEWLFGTCQHTVIADYVRLLTNLCEWNMDSRQFMLAVSLLDCGETHKAYDLFLKAAEGVTKEQFLAEKILKSTPYASILENFSDHKTKELQLKQVNQCIAQYYLKVIQLFEQHNALDHVITIAKVAIGLLDKTDPQLPMFQSIIFNNHLLLEHYEEAYHSLIYITDLSRRKDCLRQLVITLFSCKRLDLLMQFPYVALHEEFENIVESRARSQPMEQNEVYDFLYAFHVNNGNMRKASLVMYEQAMRLQLECDSIESMQKRCYCLLTCLNALHLTDKRYRWIAKPVIGEDYDYSYRAIREENGIDQLDPSHKTHVEVIEMKHIKREILHTEALIQLVRQRKDVQNFLNMGPTELTMILCSCGLYTSALKLAKGFSISLLSIFESLTGVCVRSSEDNLQDAWTWLLENDLADLSYRNKGVDMAWDLLQKLLEDNEDEGSTQIKKCVVNKLLSLQAFVPQWLYNSYKLNNCSELLRLYVKHNRLLEAAELSQEMLSAFLGAGREYFSFKFSMTVSNPELCLPLNTLDLLLHGLQINGEDTEYRKAFVELEEKINQYIETATRTALDKMELGFQLRKDHEKEKLRE
uniref:Nuclear pore complex protein Nup160 homolog n=1 Tax=Glossina brevipalpis TaxID=37001 RepID=A0A1A9W7W3_9MUSC